MLQLTWSWQPALYLFLGGMGAGAFIMAAVLFLIDKAKHKLVVCVSMWAAFVSLAVGLLLLLSELISPVRGMMMWSAFSNFSSWMTYGAWGAFCALVVWAVSAVLAVPAVGKRLAKAKWLPTLRVVLAWVGIALGAFVAVYTGMLLMTAGGVPLWDSPLLPALFTVSAFDTGVALVELVVVVLSKKGPLAHRAAALMERIVIVLVVLEAAVLAAFLWAMLSADPASAWGQAAVASAQLLTSGGLSTVFWWMFVACGLAVPLIAAIAGLVLGKRETRPVMAIGAVGALVGGCELRFLILAAGVHASVLSATVMGLLL